MARPIKHFHKYRYDEALGKYIRKKHYKYKEITMVKLDPEQALLVACITGGLYMTQIAPGDTWCMRRLATGAPFSSPCRRAARGPIVPGRYFTERHGFSPPS